MPAALEKVGTGTLCLLSEDEHGKTYGRALTVADRLGADRILLAKWIRRLTNWNGRQVPVAVWEEKVVPLLKERLAQQKTPVVRLQNQAQRIVALVSIADLTMRVPVDRYGVALWKPVEREVLPADCARCPLVPVCRQLPASTGVALLWRRLGLVDAAGVPTLRGRVVSFFSQGDGLAIAAALEDKSYPLDELIYDLANLDAGFRFAGEETNRWGGRLGIVCHERYGLQSIPGYLENGVPPKYGAGAEQIVASVHKNPLNKQAWIRDLLGPGDIDRVIIEWRSLLRQTGARPGPGLAPLARSPGPRQNHPQRDRVPYPHRPAPPRIPPNPPRGSPPDSPAALSLTRSALCHFPSAINHPPIAKPQSQSG